MSQKISPFNKNAVYDEKKKRYVIKDLRSFGAEEPKTVREFKEFWRL
jgi:hypothetical protein